MSLPPPPFFSSILQDAVDPFPSLLRREWYFIAEQRAPALCSVPAAFASTFRMNSISASHLPPSWCVLLRARTLRPPSGCQTESGPLEAVHLSRHKWPGGISRFQENQTPIPEPRTPNPKPQTPHPKPQTPNSKPKTPNPEPRTPNPKPQTQNPPHFSPGENSPLLEVPPSVLERIAAKAASRLSSKLRVSGAAGEVTTTL